MLDIGNKKILKDYYSILYRLTGVNIDFVSPSGEILKLCSYEHYNDFCKFIRTTEKGCEACDNCSISAIHKAELTGQSIVYKCHASLVDIAVPLFVNKKFAGCLTTGQILTSQPTEKSFAEVKKQLEYLDLDEKKLKKYYFDTVVLEEDRLQALIELVALIGNYIVESENKLLFLEGFNEGDKISGVRQYIEKNYQKKINIADVANLVFLSTSHFSHLFKKEVGTSFVQYLNRFRIEKAKELLTNSNLNVTEIAYEVGFQSLPHFNRIFRKLEKRSPKEYQKAENAKN